MRIVAVAAVIFALLYFWLDVNALAAMRTNQNTGLYLQTLVNFSKDGSTFNYADNKPHAQAHNQWIVYALAPLVALAPRPQTLLAVQVLLLAAAAPILYALARRLGATNQVAIVLALAYLIAPSTQGFAYGGFVPEVAIPLLAFSLALGVMRRSLPLSLAAGFALTGIKEDQTLFLLWFGAVIAVFYDRRIGLSLAAVAAGVAAAYYAYAAHAGFTPERPAYAPADNEWPQQLAFVAEILVPLAFAPLRLGVRMLLALPVAAELFFAQDRPIAMYRAGSYYTASFVTLATIGAVFVLAKRPRWSRFALGGAILMALFFNPTVLHIGRHPFSTDPQYSIASAWGRTDQPVDFPCEDEGAWVVASSNPSARLSGCGHGLNRLRAAWRDEPLASQAAWTRGPSPGAR